MTTPGALARAREQVARRVAAGGDERTLRHDVLDLVRQVVPFDAYAWVLTDPQTCVGTSPLAETPSLADLPQLVRLKYLTDVNRWTSITDPPVAALRAATGGDLGSSLVWRELLSTYGIGDVASSVHRDRFGCWGFLDLWRNGDGSAFGPAEVALLADLAALLTPALRSCAAQALVAPPGGSPVTGPVVLLLSDELDVGARTPQTADYLRALVPVERGSEPVPAVAYNVAAQLLAREAGVDDRPPWARVHVTGHRLVTVRADRVEGDAGAPYGIAVTIEPSTAAERADLFVRAFGLSAREAELLTAMATGADTRELAKVLSVSEHTVQDHLKNVFAKTSARSRSQLLAWVRGA
jgi:DNA-binding CsgD family transcriptional regulator